MVTRGRATSAADFLPPDPHPTLAQLRAAAAGCKGCPLYKLGTQTVFGEGPATNGAAPTVRAVLVGEAPGDREDLAGRPFVGPAGQLLDRALEEAGIARSQVYLTNAVKHFKWIPGGPRGKRRIHVKPAATEIRACRPWLESELAVVKPRVIVCLGATAAQALMGAAFRVTRDRGTFFDETPYRPARVVATVHPSAILRAPEPEQRDRAFAEFVADLRKVAAAIR